MSSSTAAESGKILRRPNLMHVVHCIIAKSGLEIITGDWKTLQTIFRKIKEEAEGLEATLLTDLVFGTNEVFPRSIDLDRIFTCQLAGFLLIRTLIATEPREYVIDQELAQEILEKAPRIFSVEQIQALDALTEKFQQHLAEEDEKV